jgi:DNA polymerase III delta prime subunit
LKDRLGCSFLDLDYCWHLVFERNKSDEVHVLKLSPGEKGFDWENQRKLGVAAIGWNSCGPLSKYEKLEEAVKVCEKNGECKSPGYLLEQFQYIYNEMDEGDLVLYYKSGSIVGIGVVADDEYKFVENQKHAHQRRVTFLDPFTPVSISDNDDLRKFFGNRNTIRKLTGKKLSDAVELIAQANPQHDMHTLMGDSVSRPRKDDLPIGGHHSSFVGFKDETFEVLDKFQKNPTKDTYKVNKDAFNRSIRDPMRTLFFQLAPGVRKVVENALETRTNLLSRITKNDYGKGGLYHYFWGAFYDPEAGRQDSSQLYVILREGLVRFGFGWGVNAAEYKERLNRNIKKYGVIDDDYLKVLSEKGVKIKIPGSDDIASTEKTLDPIGFLKAVVDHERPSLEVSIVKDAAIKMGADLGTRIEEVFDLLMPVMILSTFDSPQQYLDRWQAIHAETEDDGEEEDSSINWEEFIAEMNWDERAQESEGIFRLLDVQNDYENAKRQLVFYGAPGTGKTRAALEVARVIGSSDQCIERVQFHQSYSYENFIEGIRPIARGGAISYEIEPGPFVKFCRRAMKSPGKRFVFIVDEINRGNLSRIFGELMFLLEYRDKAMPLLYSKTSFEIPSNVFIIGTMNSADRSLALVDYALRRRFSFVEFAPSAHVVAQWYSTENDEHKACLKFFELLNEKISLSDRRLAIGHSYLLHEHLRLTGLSKRALKDIWISSVYPLLEEYFCNLPNKLSQFSFEELWKTAVGIREEKDAA